MINSPRYIVWTVFAFQKLYSLFTKFQENIIHKMSILYDSHFQFKCSLWILAMCFFKSPESKNDLPQHSHFYSLRPLWTLLMCPFKFSSWENDLPHNLCGLHEMSGYVSINFLVGKMITIIVGYLYLVLAYLGLSSQIESSKYIHIKTKY